MLIPFDQMPDTARLWVYALDHDLAPAEAASVKEQMETFADNWAAHQQPLRAAVAIERNRFLLLAVDEQYNAVSGCAIDHSARLIEKIESQVRGQMLDRGRIHYQHETSIRTAPFLKAKSLVLAGEITPQTTIYDHTVGTVGDFRHRFAQRAADSWLRRFFQALVA